MKNTIKDKRGQLDNPILAFAVIAIMLLVFAPIALKIFLNINTSFGNSLGNVSSGGNLAKTNFQAVTIPLITWWDKVVISAFVLSIILLFVSAFLIDAHPFFIVLYILLNAFLIIFTPNILQAVDNIYDSANFATEVAQLTFLDSLRNNFIPFLVGIIIVTGIIIYGKLAFFGGGRANNRI